MFSPNEKLKGYFRFGGLYVSHGRVLAILVALLAAGAVYIQTLHPTIMRLWISRVPVPSFVINSVYMEGYSGMARLVGKDGELIYEGRLVNGAAQGHGKLYSDGELVYEGDFYENKYSGVGRLYSGGTLVYEGEFLENLYNGQGTLYSPNGELYYKGGFISEQMSGEGKFYTGGSVLYEGGVTNGVYEGKGKLYDAASGKLIYEGSFSGGQYGGEGKQYDASTGKLIYEGGFALDEYEGEGRLYSGGSLLYSGNFLGGEYSGAGVLYGGQGMVVYDGQWAGGLYEGQGKLYVKGSLMYEGEFSGGVYSGEGKEYYPDTGYPKYAGRFLEGKYMDSGVFYDEKGRPILLKPQLDAENLLGLSYSEVIEFLKDAEQEYSEMELDGSPSMLLESINRIIRFNKDLKSETPGTVTAVYLCGLDAASGALTSMAFPDIRLALGEPKGEAPVLPGAVEILALTISNGFWSREVQAENTRGLLFCGEERQITVFFEMTDGEPGQALFFKVV